MIRIIAAVGLSASLSACQTASTDSFTGPTGAQVQSTKCSQSPQACFKTASATCKGPYQVIDSHSNAGGLVADLIPGPVTWYSMTYQCGRSDGAFPKFPFRGSTYSAPSITSPQSPSPDSTYSPPRTTNCYQNGNFTNCTTY